MCQVSLVVKDILETFKPWSALPSRVSVIKNAMSKFAQSLVPYIWVGLLFNIAIMVQMRFINTIKNDLFFFLKMYQYDISILPLKSEYKQFLFFGS